MLRIGIDTGGTFTDFVVLEDGSVSVFKIPSTPEHPEQAVLSGLSNILKGRQSYLLQHGSTVATNAFLERKGAKCVLITNQGFEDLIEIGRQNRPGLYELKASRPEVLIPPRFRIGMRERTAWDGKQVVRLGEKSLDWMKGRIGQLKPESVAVVLLYSYLSPENEQRIAEKLKDFSLPISLSHQILPEFREYERTSTTVINAYVQPKMSGYLSALKEDNRVKQGRLTIMQSNGGSISVDSASREPVRTLFSGPAGGVVGAFEVARLAGYDKILTLDMGGTSTDVCLCDGAIETTSESMIDHHPISIQTIGIHTVGAGGGSIAWVDEGGLLKVGPQSAGAEPGPICYGKGSDLTVTDANVFLGRLDPDYFLGGEIKLQPAGVAPALGKLGDKLAKSSDRSWEPAELAEGIIKIVNTQMERALRVISLQRGFDTRDFTLVTFGGAGGLHACALARSLMIPRVLVPLDPGTLSALGILRADVVQDASRTRLIVTNEKGFLQTVKEQLDGLEGEVRQKLKRQDFQDDAITVEKSVDARYLGQSYEITVPLSENVVEDFHAKHEQLYGYASPGGTVEIVNLRVRGRGRFSLPEPTKKPERGETPAEDSLLQEKRVFIDGELVPLRFYLRSRLGVGNQISGPAAVLEYGSTTFVPADFKFRVDPWLNLIIEPNA